MDALVSPEVAIVYDRSGVNGRGTRIEVASFTMHVTLNGGQCVLDKNGPINLVESPDPCYAIGGFNWCQPGGGGGGGNGADGGNVTNDQWAPQAAFQWANPVAQTGPEFIVTWYDTSGDPTNTLELVRGAGNITGLLGNPFFTPTLTPTIKQLSNGAGVPWAHNQDQWSDYQGIGVDYINNKFLAAWGGDARAAPGGPSGVMTALITP